MSDADKLLQEQYLPFCERVVDAFEQQHPTFSAAINSFLAGKKNQFGIRLTENEKVIGEYTLYLEGMHLSKIDNGVLSSEVHTPFGVFKPYAIMEKSTMEQIIQDEQSFINNVFKAKMKYIHDVTIKFLK